MGNQMFEYAAGLALAKKYNAELVLDTTYLADRFPRKDFTPRHYELNAFTISPQFTGLSRAAHAVPIPGVWLAVGSRAHESARRLRSRKLIVEKHRAAIRSIGFGCGRQCVPLGAMAERKIF